LMVLWSLKLYYMAFVFMNFVFLFVMMMADYSLLMAPVVW
jgi:hypothetical protein